MKRSFLFILLLVNTSFGLHGMELSVAQDSKIQSSTSIFDRVPKGIAGYLYGIPQFFSLKQQIQTYGIMSDDGISFKQLDNDVYDEIKDLFEEADFDCRSLHILPLNSQAAINTPGFVVTHKSVFIDQQWWQSIGINMSAQETREIQRFFVALMIEQLKKSHYRKQLATKIVVDGVLVSTFIGIVTYTLAPTMCSWIADTIPGTQWIEHVPTAISTTVQSTCDQFYAPDVCIMAGKTAWSSLLAPTVGPCVHAVFTESVAQYLSQQSSSKALESIVNRQALADYCTRQKTQGAPHTHFNELERMVENASYEHSDY